LNNDHLWITATNGNPRVFTGVTKLTLELFCRSGLGLPWIISWRNDGNVLTRPGLPELCLIKLCFTGPRLCLTGDILTGLGPIYEKYMFSIKLPSKLKTVCFKWRNTYTHVFIKTQIHSRIHKDTNTLTYTHTLIQTYTCAHTSAHTCTHITTNVPCNSKEIILQQRSCQNQ